MKERCQRLIGGSFITLRRGRQCKNFGYKKLGNIVYCYVHNKEKRGGTCPTSGG